MRASRALIVAGAAMAMLLAGSGGASAVGVEYGVTSGNGSILGGNQVIAPISILITVCGNAVAVLGISGSGCLKG
ncbi:hypothetical protein AB0F13_18280 [Streptomyces sp. NPDC026206]|uniref:hypothetical protein n=1 Tax=Streptomyces sp. NPDC026206 TaxID=3157089 RepID=UPI003407A146